MLKVGLTGNIGSGKSLIAKIFKTLGVPVFSADAEGKKVLDAPEVVSKIKSLFGQDVITENKVNKEALAGMVFSNKSKLRSLNNIIHPEVRKKFDHWASRQNRFPYVIYEAAILLESGHYRYMDKIILVTAEENLRIERVMKRDKITAEMVRKRMNNQWAESKKLGLADFVINNNETTPLIPQILEIHKTLTALSNHSRKLPGADFNQVV
jgi:dephospho-CoA kinase